MVAPRVLAPRIPGDRWPRIGVAATLALALALFAGIFVLRAGDPNVGDGEGILFVVPIGALALQFGLRGGLVGALTAYVLMASWEHTHEHSTLTALGYVNRGVAFLVLGMLLGAFADHRRKLEQEVHRYYDASLESERKAQLQLVNSARSLERKVAERTHELDDARAETLQLLAIAVEYRDDETFEHTERVGTLAAEISVLLGMRAEHVRRIREAAPLHDVGKIAIPDAILLKRGSLTPEERVIVQTHTGLGARLLSNSSSPVLQMAAVIAATHHEWWDGSGYPSGLAGERIPLVGRVVAVADVFDALTHVRPYKPAWPVAQAIARIERASGSQFDPRVVEAFMSLHEDHVRLARARSTSSVNSVSSSFAGNGLVTAVVESTTMARLSANPRMSM
jgi:HD-GYP domain-containing protein (c-di-GMP phosphodiesterase class II)